MRESPLVVELVGPAGAGKSTLTKALTECDENIRAGAFPNVRQMQDLPFFFWNMFQLLPVFYTAGRDHTGKLLTAEQMAIMAILQGWPQLLRSLNRTNGQTIVLDQGPVYMLAELLSHRSPDSSTIVSEWWRSVCDRWASVLDMVICLDTSDAILIERVRARERQHRIKDNSDAWAVQLLAHHREAQNYVLDSIARADQGVEVARIDTAQAGLTQSIQTILRLINEVNQT